MTRLWRIRGGSGPSANERRYGVLCLFWLLQNVQWGAMVALALPQRLGVLGGAASAAAHLGLLVGAGSLVSMLGQPLFGLWSDRAWQRGVPRRSWLLGGLAVNAIGLCLLAIGAVVWMTSAAFILVEAGSACAVSAYQGHMAQLIPPHKRGVVSGYLGSMSLLGTGLSFGLAVLTVHVGGDAWYFLISCGCLLVGGVLVWRPHEAAVWVPAVPVQLPRARGFFWVLINRALMMTALAAVLTFLAGDLAQRFRLSVVLGRTEGVVVGVLLGAALAALMAGRVSDRVGRRTLLFGSCLLMVPTLFCLTFDAPWGWLMASGIALGLGYGAFLTVDWALAVEHLPSGGYMARDMGVWGVASALPQTVAPLAGAWLLQAERGPVLMAYHTLFGASLVVALLSMVAIWGIGASRGQSTDASSLTVG